MNSSTLDTRDQDGMQPSDDEMRDALARVVASDEFSSALRLQQFFSYVAGESIAGRGDAIVGKAIAVDDPWRIQIDFGRYGPRFEPGTTGMSSFGSASPYAAGSPRLKAILGGSLVSIALFAVGIAFKSDVEEPENIVGNSEASRAAYRERSIQAVQAVSLAEEARGLLFSALDLKRQEIALEMFRHSISRDPGQHHGYSGAAQALTTLALLSPDESSAEGYAREATEMANKALNIAPSDTWPHLPIDLIVARIFRNAPAIGNDILERLGKYDYPGG